MYRFIFIAKIYVPLGFMLSQSDKFKMIINKVGNLYHETNKQRKK
jgi:hypothetical protein